MTATVSSRASMLLAEAFLWENHCCVPLKDPDRWLPQLQRYRAAGFSVVHVNIGDSDVPLDQMIRALASYRAWLRARPAEYTLIGGVEDTLRAKQECKLAVCFDIEGAQALRGDIALLSLFYELGVRWLSLVYNCANLLGGGCHDARDEGLTPLGRRFIAAMEEVGMVKDVAHAGYRTALEVCDSSGTPVTISHSNPRALTDHPRCIPDDLMKACAATGGVLGISGVGIFLGSNDTSTANIVRSIDYAVDVMGIDHVGIGLDYVFDVEDMSGETEAKPNFWPEGYGYGRSTRFVPPEQITEIVGALLDRGYRNEDVAKILGGNFLRVARQVWK